MFSFDANVGGEVGLLKRVGRFVNQYVMRWLEVAHRQMLADQEAKSALCCYAMEYAASLKPLPRFPLPVLFYMNSSLIRNHRCRAIAETFATRTCSPRMEGICPAIPAIRICQSLQNRSLAVFVMVPVGMKVTRE